MATELHYQSGFGNEFATEALAGALPIGQNSPQTVAYGLYAEQVSGTPFTLPRKENRRSWFYRIKPSVMHRPFEVVDSRFLRSAPCDEAPATPNQLRWDPIAFPSEPTTFLQGLCTVGLNGDVASLTGFAIHLYVANTSMEGEYFQNADGEMLIVPQEGVIRVHTECGILEVAPTEICLIPRGIKFRVEIVSGPVRGYVCENYGAAFRLPDLGPIGANGLAAPRDFLAPVAAYEDLEGDFTQYVKFQGSLWAAKIDHSPLNVVAWHGNYTPYKYDLLKFQAVNTVNFDHPDPSIFTVLTAPTDTPGFANIDFVIFPSRWMVAEHTFRPPYFHRNFMNEFMGLIKGVYDAKAEGFLPGGFSMHNCMQGHGPDGVTFDKASTAELRPEYLDKTLAFMFETRFAIRPTAYALSAPELQPQYFEVWQTLKKYFTGPSRG